MSFLMPKAPSPPPMPAIPPPAPIAPVAAVDSKEEDSTKERLRRKKGVSSTILTGPRGLLPEQMPVSTPYLLGGNN
tara:strand:- start:277 stop:504 length:228 start_codon:yes stop_codon:yes gene_type:complete